MVPNRPGLGLGLGLGLELGLGLGLGLGLEASDRGQQAWLSAGSGLCGCCLYWGRSACRLLAQRRGRGAGAGDAPVDLVERLLERLALRSHLRQVKLAEQEEAGLLRGPWRRCAMRRAARRRRAARGDDPARDAGEDHEHKLRVEFGNSIPVHGG